MRFSKEFLKVNENKINIGTKAKPIKVEADKEITKKYPKYFGISFS